MKNFPSNIAKNLDYLMKKNGLNPFSLAKKAGLKDAYIRNILEGRSLSPNISKIKNVAKIFNINVEDLYEKNLSLHEEKQRYKPNSQNQGNISLSEEKFKFLLEAQISAATCNNLEKELLFAALKSATEKQLLNCVSGLIQKGLQNSNDLIPWLESIFEVHFDARFPEADELPLLTAKAAS